MRDHISSEIRGTEIVVCLSYPGSVDKGLIRIMRKFQIHLHPKKIRSKLPVQSCHNRRPKFVFLNLRDQNALLINEGEFDKCLCRLALEQKMQET